MNKILVDDYDIQQEPKTCENIFEILSHLAVFNPLITCIFPEVASLGRVTYFAILPDKSSREHYITLHIDKIVEYFQEKENVKKFASEIEKFYLEHKKALDKAWINDSHKNAYSIAIATLRAVADMQSRVNSKVINRTSTNLNQIPDINSQVITKFYEIFNEYKKFNYAWDIEWNLPVNDARNNWWIRDLFGKKVSKIWWKFVSLDTRNPELLKSWGEIIELLDESELDWDVMIGAKVKRDDWTIWYPGLLKGWIK